MVNGQEHHDDNTMKTLVKASGSRISAAQIRDRARVSQAPRACT